MAGYKRVRLLGLTWRDCMVDNVVEILSFFPEKSVEEVAIAVFCGAGVYAAEYWKTLSPHGKHRFLREAASVAVARGVCFSSVSVDLGQDKLHHLSPQNSFGSVAGVYERDKNKWVGRRRHTSYR